MRAFVTGGTGFVGGAVVRRLLAEGHEVRALVRPGSKTIQLDGLPVERIDGDLSSVDYLRRGMQGCDWAFHVAALYSYWGHPWREFYRANVQGTRRVLRAASQAGVQRIVHTSSIAVIAPPRSGHVADESTPSSLADMFGHYKRSKFLAEQVALGAARHGLPVVIVNPTSPVGPGDHKPTPTGKVIVDYLNGRMPAYVDNRQNLVDVHDVATGHLLAAQLGKPGERYILGGENVTLKQWLDLLSEVSGQPPVRVRIPYAVALGWSYIDTTLARLVHSHEPAAAPETVRLSRVHSFFDSSKAVRELGYSPGPVKRALRRAVEWYRTHGYAPTAV